MKTGAVLRLQFVNYTLATVSKHRQRERLGRAHRAGGRSHIFSALMEVTCAITRGAAGEESASKQAKAEGGCSHCSALAH